MSQSDQSIGNINPGSEIRTCEALKGKCSPSDLLLPHLHGLARYREARGKATCYFKLGLPLQCFMLGLVADIPGSPHREDRSITHTFHLPGRDLNSQETLWVGIS